MSKEHKEKITILPDRNFIIIISEENIPFDKILKAIGIKKEDE